MPFVLSGAIVLLQNFPMGVPALTGHYLAPSWAVSAQESGRKYNWLPVVEGFRRERFVFRNLGEIMIREHHSDKRAATVILPAFDNILRHSSRRHSPKDAARIIYKDEYVLGFILL
jgi:hypothetical protein